jgi:hypothetical protein
LTNSRRVHFDFPIDASLKIPLSEYAKERRTRVYTRLQYVSNTVRRPIEGC